MNTQTAGWTNSRFVTFFTASPFRFWLTIVIVFSLSRVATWGYPYDSDHWIFYYVGKEWIVNGGQLYVDAWDHKPPMIFLYNGVMAALFGDNIVLHRIWFTLFAVIDTWLFYRVITNFIPSLLSSLKTQVNSERAIQLTLILYVFLRNLSPFASNGNTTENLGLVFLLAMILCFMRFLKTSSLAWLALSGFWVGNLFWIKGNLILLGGVIGLVLLIQGWKNKPRLALHVLVFVAPILMISATWMAYFAIQGTFQDFMIAAFSFSAKYASSAWAGKLSANIVLLLITSAMLVPAVIFFVLFARDVRLQFTKPAYQITGLSFLVGLALIGAVGSFYSYYLLIIIPFITIMMMYGLFRLNSLSPLIRKSVVALFVVTIALNSAISLRFLANNFGGITVQEGQDFTEAAAYVTEHTQPGDKVFAYDYGATFYEMAQRDSASRFISASHLLLDYRDNFGFGFDEIFLGELEKSKPPFIVLNDRSQELYFENLPVAEYITEHYKDVAKFGAIDVLKRVK